MKILVFVLCMLLPGLAGAVDALVSWTPNPASENVTRYELTAYEQGQTPAQGTTVAVVAPAPNSTSRVEGRVTGLQQGKSYRFFVVAVVAGAEFEDKSDPSAEVTARVPFQVSRPQGVEVEVIKVVIP